MPERKINYEISWIEDNEAILSSSLEPLVDEGFKIHVYESYLKARSNIESIRDSSLLILDASIPFGDFDSGHVKDNLGIDLLRELREEGISVPAIIWTRGSRIEIGEIDREAFSYLNAIQLPPVIRPSQIRKLVHEMIGIE